MANWIDQVVKADALNLAFQAIRLYLMDWNRTMVWDLGSNNSCFWNCGFVKLGLHRSSLSWLLCNFILVCRLISLVDFLLAIKHLSNGWLGLSVYFLVLKWKLGPWLLWVCHKLIEVWVDFSVLLLLYPFDQPFPLYISDDLNLCLFLTGTQCVLHDVNLRGLKLIVLCFKWLWLVGIVVVAQSTDVTSWETWPLHFYLLVELFEMCQRALGRSSFHRLQSLLDLLRSRPAELGRRHTHQLEAIHAWCQLDIATGKLMGAANNAYLRSSSAFAELWSRCGGLIFCKSVTIYVVRFVEALLTRLFLWDHDFEVVRSLVEPNRLQDFAVHWRALLTLGVTNHCVLALVIALPCMCVKNFVAWWETQMVLISVV